MISKRFKISVLLIGFTMITVMSIKIMSLFDLIEYGKLTQIVEFILFIVFILSSLQLVSSVFDSYISSQKERRKMEDLMNQSSLFSKTDRYGKITEVNDIFCQVSGYKRHELLGKDHNILSSGKHSKDFWSKMYESTVNYRAVWNEIVVNKKKDGSDYIVNSWIKAIFDNRGKHTGFVSVRQDITDLHKSLNEIKEKEEELSGIMSAINKSSLTIDFCLNGFIIDANENFLNTMGYTLHEITGKHHSIFMDEAIINTESYSKFWSDLKAGKSKDGEYLMISKEGESVWLNSTYNPIIDTTGKIVKIMSISTNITDAVQQKIDLKRNNSYLEYASKILRHDMHSGINIYIPRGIKSLERRIDKISKECNISKEKIELMIGSPMKLIKEGLNHAQRVYTGVREFTNLVKKDSVLETKRCDLTQALLNHLKSTAYKSHVKIEQLGVDEVNCSLFCTAIDNLIRNGLKYNDSETKKVKIYRDSENNIIVEDNGRGMTQEEFEEYSKPYTRKGTNKESGSGLGLNICIAILREHGWKLNLIKSKKGTRLAISTYK